MPTPRPTADQSNTTRRRHDLDALRAFAMLLGIALHAALAFAPIPWIAMNDETSPALVTFFEIIHGFRLPLFFMMSGFFSAMLIQRRGIRGYLRHRGRRIGLPLLLGMVTIIPVMWGVIIGGHVVKSIVPSPDRDWGLGDETNIWNAATAGDLEAVTLLVQAGVPVDRPDPQVYTLPIAWASTGDHADIVAFLLESGADPNQRMGDENTPMHTACFFGAAESVELMLEAGADLGARNRHGETPIDSMRHDKGTVEFIANILGVQVDFQRVEDGRRRITELLGERADLAPAGPPTSPLRSLILEGELFMHLWFLWHLCWLAGALALVTSLVRLLPWSHAPSLVVSTPLCLLGLVPLTALTQGWQAGFGPDTSAALVPQPHVLTHYAVFFGFGAMMFTSRDAADRLGRAWWAWLPLATITCIGALRLTHDPAAFAEQGLEADAGASLGLLLQSTFVWTTAFGLIGLFRRLSRRPHARVRYLSDASYWMYLVHLPIVVAGQFALTYVPLPPLVEFTILTIATTAILLPSYHWLVRYTWVGRLLHGPRLRT